MLDSAAIGLIVGFLGRAGPEVLKFFDRMLDRQHELAMQDKALEFEKLRPGKVDAFGMSVDAGQLQDVLGLMREAYSQQFDTGNPWLNAISVLVRPMTTGLLLLLYVGVKVAMLAAAFVAPGSAAPIIADAYTDMDVTILSGVLAFWFVDRGLFKQGGK